MWSSPAIIGLDLFLILTLILTLILPIFIFRYLRRNTQRFRTGPFKAQFGDTVGVLTHRNENSSYYVLIFCYSRAFFIAFIVFYSEAYVQVTAAILVI